MCASDSVCRIAVAKNRKFATARGISRRARERNRLAGIDRFGASEFLQVAFDQIGDAQQKARAFGCRCSLTNRKTLSPPQQPQDQRLVRRCPRPANTALPVAGSMLSRYFPLIGSTNSPSMKFRIWGDSLRTARDCKRLTRSAQRAVRRLQGNIERLTRSSPDALAATLRGATVYVARPAPLHSSTSLGMTKNGAARRA